MVNKSDEQKCCHEWRETYKFCPVHTPHTPSSDWEKPFDELIKKGIMSEKIIEEYTDTRCKHPEHDPASMIVRKAGRYEHTCPACGEVQTFEVPLVTL